MASGSLDNITVAEQRTNFEKLQKVYLDGVMPLVNILTFPNVRSEDVRKYLDVSLTQMDGYNQNKITTINSK